MIQILRPSADPFSMRSRFFTVFTAFIVASAATLTFITTAPASAASGTPTVEITGHGWGHGWGLSQYGSYGYAIGHATGTPWSSAQILNHFYGGTTAGSIPASAALDPDALRIDIRSDRGAPTSVELPSGRIRLWAGSDGRDVGQFDPHAVRLVVNNSNDGFLVFLSESGCSGSWVLSGEIENETRIRIEAETDNTGEPGLLRYCRGNGSKTSYPGELEAVNWSGSNSGARTVNIVSLEDYLRGVVPKESPASWGGPSAGPATAGIAALEAQSVAARSYVMSSDDRYTNTFADSCDTTLCQVYGGWYQTNSSGVTTPVHDWRTDQAIASTAGLVRIRNDNGKVARTFFSSSTGGHTAPIDPFPAVIDLGDSVPANPNHEWTKTIDLTSLENSSGKGAVQEVVVTERNGFGGEWEDGGRVEQVTVVFENGERTFTGGSFRSTFGLKSDWFSAGEVLRDGVPVNSNGKFVDGAAEVFLGRAATSTERTRWLALVNQDNRRAFISELAASDEWAGALIDDLYRDVLGRGADEEGREYWRAEMANGESLEAVGTYFYGSTEYYNSVGATPQGFVSSLYERILDREPEIDGFEYWIGLLEQDKATIVDVAHSFYASDESRQQRTNNLFVRLLGRQSDGEGLLFWSARLATITDLELAVELALTQEFADRLYGD